MRKIMTLWALTALMLAAAGAEASTMPNPPRPGAGDCGPMYAGSFYLGAPSCSGQQAALTQAGLALRRAALRAESLRWSTDRFGSSRYSIGRASLLGLVGGGAMAVDIEVWDLLSGEGDGRSLTVRLGNTPGGMVSLTIFMDEQRNALSVAARRSRGIGRWEAVTDVDAVVAYAARAAEAASH